VGGRDARWRTSGIRGEPLRGLPSKEGAPSKEAAAARFEDGRMPPLLDSRVRDPRVGFEGATAGWPSKEARHRRKPRLLDSRTAWNQPLLDPRVGDPRAGFEGGGSTASKESARMEGSAEGAQDSRVRDPRLRRKPRGWKEAREGGGRWQARNAWGRRQNRAPRKCGRL
jgi:hypothetical protein